MDQAAAFHMDQAVGCRMALEEVCPTVLEEVCLTAQVVACHMGRAAACPQTIAIGGLGVRASQACSGKSGIVKMVALAEKGPN
jgi:hypothetical protein